MKKELVQTLTDTFEGHAQQTETGVEFWLARDVQHLLGYAEWRNSSFLISKGDHALFGKSTQAMKAQWKVPDSRPLADFAPTILLKAKDFAAEITIFNVRQHQMALEVQISNEHITNNQAVRSTLLERGIRPESLPPEEDVKKVERRLQSDDKKILKHEADKHKSAPTTQTKEGT